MGGRREREMNGWEKRERERTKIKHRARSERTEKEPSPRGITFWHTRAWLNIRAPASADTGFN